VRSHVAAQKGGGTRGRAPRRRSVPTGNKNPKWQSRNFWAWNRHRRRKFCPEMSSSNDPDLSPANKLKKLNGGWAWEAHWTMTKQCPQTPPTHQEGIKPVPARHTLPEQPRRAHPATHTASQVARWVAVISAAVAAVWQEGRVRRA